MDGSGEFLRPAVGRQEDGDFHWAMMSTVNRADRNRWPVSPTVTNPYSHDWMSKDSTPGISSAASRAALIEFAPSSAIHPHTCASALSVDVLAARQRMVNF